MITHAIGFDRQVFSRDFIVYYGIIDNFIYKKPL